ncbi:MAG: hypothetical protein JJU45_16685 [Acidimicrobiia bacterium]|nr:hypothetical protein [Acidimicrobiia bacterium]
MSDTSQGPGWWQASDGKWYAPELHPDAAARTVQYDPAAHAESVPSTEVRSTGGPPTGADPTAVVQPPQGMPPTTPTSTPPAAMAPGGPPPGATPPGATPPGATPPGVGPTPPPAQPSRNRTPLIIALVVLLAAVLGVGAGLLLTRGGDESTSERTERSDRQDRTTTTTTTEAPTTTTEAPTTTAAPTTPPPTSPPGVDFFDDLPPELQQILTQRILEDPELLAAFEALGPDEEPSIELTVQILGIIIEAGGRDILEQEILADAGLTATEQACVADLFASLDDAEFLAFIEGAGRESPEALALLAPCIP